MGIWLMICTVLSCIALTFAPAPFIDGQLQGYYQAVKMGEIIPQPKNRQFMRLNKIKDLHWKIRNCANWTRETTSDIWHDDYCMLGGDCEDFALTLRKTIIKRNKQGGGIALTRNNTHAVLWIPTAQGVYISDINYRAPIHIDKYGKDRISMVEIEGKWWRV